MHPSQKLYDIFDVLLKTYGYQGWWPLSISKILPDDRVNLEKGYHPEDYRFPKTKEQQLEICLGAVLTQNTNWKNVTPALKELKSRGLLSITLLQKSESDQIALAIKSAGYYNQKTQTIKRLVSFLVDNPFHHLNELKSPIIREKLINIKGIGPETADCILLYALSRCSFVVDAYTKRIMTGIGLIGEKAGYDDLKNLFETSLEKNLQLFQEYHALLVCHGKRYYSRKPYGRDDQLLEVFKS